MARMLKSVSLLLIGGGIGAFVSSALQEAPPAIEQPSTGVAPSAMTLVADRSDADQASTPRAQITRVVQFGAHQLTATSGDATPDPKRRVERSDRIRVAQAGARTSDVPVMPLPRMRPIPIGTGNANSSATSDGRSAETKLAESIQTELKRVGCYTGGIDGDWGNETRRAMRAFNDRVNASLPIDRPDYILLTLLQGHAAKACGAACPAGQELSDHKKCLPRSVIAEERRRLLAERGADTQTPRAAIALAAPTSDKAAPTDGVRPGSPSMTAADDRRAALERERIATAEVRREREAAEIVARQDKERRDQAIEADKARAAAEARRREEIAILAARAAARATAAAAPRPAKSDPPVTTASVATSPLPPLPIRPSHAFQQQAAAARVDAQGESDATQPAPTHHHAPPHRKSRGARYVGQFMPPPMYRVGRLPAYRAASVRVYAYAPRPVYRRHNPQGIFRELQYRMP